MRQLIMNGTEAQMQTWADADAFQMKQMQGYIGVRGGANIYELSDIPADRMKLYNSIYYQQVHFDVRVKDTRWVVLRYPTSSMAQLASMSTDEFEEFYFNVCTMDYGKMSKAMDALKELMDRTDKVRLVGPGTDLTFSIKGIGGVKCDGELNIPDGEVYSAPVRESVNGIISYNTPTPHDGFIFENIVLEFRKW